jgi:hypothetical protein
VFDAASTAITAVQEPQAKLPQAGTAAPMAVRSRSLGSLNRENFIARGRCRADRQEIICLWWR